MILGSVRVALVPLLLTLAGCYRQPAEDDLARTFGSRHSEFDRLLGMAVEDKNFRRISGGEFAPPGMAQSRQDQYAAIFRDLGIEDGMHWGYPFSPDGLYVIASSCVPIGGKNRSEGYAYLTVRPDVVEKSLPDSSVPIFEIHHGSGHRLVFRHLEGRWYLFYYSEW